MSAPSKANVADASRSLLLTIATESGATSQDIARILGIAEQRVRRWLRGESRIPLGLLADLDNGLAHLPEGGLRKRVATLETIRKQRAAGHEVTVIGLPIDPVSRAGLRDDILSGRTRMDERAKRYVLKHIADPYRGELQTYQ